MLSCEIDYLICTYLQAQYSELYALTRGALVLAISKGSGTFRLPETLQDDAHSPKRKSSDSSSPSRQQRQRFPSLPGQRGLSLSAAVNIEPPTLLPRRRPKNKKKRKRLRRANTAAPFESKVLRDRKSNPDFKRSQIQRSGEVSDSSSNSPAASVAYGSREIRSSNDCSNSSGSKSNRRRSSIVPCKDPILLRAISQPLQISASSDTNSSSLSPKLQNFPSTEKHSEGDIYLLNM